MLCAKCKKDNPADASFCEKCGWKLESICAACGSSISPDAQFCKKCGTPIVALKTNTPGHQSFAGSQIKVTESTDTSSLQGERKMVTALFADIKGSTEMMEDLDPEKARAVIDPALKLMIDAANHFDGYVVQSTGDGIFALFGAPVAHEDHPQRALYAALRMQADLRRYSVKVVADGGVPIQCRIGIHTGEVVVRSIQTGAGHVEYTPIGHTTNLASRMQTAAPVGSIAVTEVTRKLCEGYFTLNAMGPTRVKGIAEPVNVYEVTGLGPLRTRLQRSAARGYSKFVGRQREMDAMKAAAEQAKAGHGQIVAAIAEAGVGKSRLFFEFKATSQSGFMVLEAFSVSHGQASAFLPVIDLLWSYFKITSDDDERTRREKITGRLLALDRSLEDALPYLYALLGLSDDNNPLADIEPQTSKRRALDAIKRILLRESLNQPLIVIFEDLHWIDDESQAFLNLLVGSIATAKILMLVNYRPQYSHQWNSKTYYTQLRLDPLSKESAEEMLGELVGNGPDVRPLKRLIIDRTDGNPLYIEEIVLVLFEDGALVRNGVVKLTRSLSQLKLPGTVQAILTARIDQLPSDEKELLQTLAVIGTEFTLNLVQEVVGAEELERRLEHLQVTEFIYEQPALADVEFRFKHVYTREAAYGSVLTEWRRSLHHRVGEAIESVYAGRLDDHYAELARHFDRGGDIDKAVVYLGHAGDRASSQAAQSEAVSYFTRAIELLEPLPDNPDRARRELGLQMALAAALHVAQWAAAPAREGALLRAQKLCEGLREDSLLTEVRLGLSVVCILRSQFTEAQELAEEALTLAQRSSDQRKISASRNTMALVQFCRGQFKSAREHYEKSVELLSPRVSGNLNQIALAENSAEGALGLTLAILGYPEAARARHRSAIAAARRDSDPFLISMALALSCVTEFELRDAAATEALAQELLAIANEHGFVAYKAAQTLFRGWVIAISGRAEEGIDQMRQVLPRTEPPPMVRSDMKVAFAEVCAQYGLLEESLTTIENGLAEAQRNAEAEFHRVRGEVMLLKVPRDEAAAERSLCTSIEVAREQAARLYELRATISLARLIDRQGRRDEARTMLADIYNWFTEGFDTQDLKDAKTLLGELSA